MDFQHQPQVSLLIPFRNEINHIPNIFTNINLLEYPHLDIIWIDDASEDGSAELLQNLLKNNSLKNRMRLIPSSGIGKKAAINTGVSQSSAEIILTTDADCRMNKYWVKFMVEPFKDQQIHLVAGPVMALDNEGFFSGFQQADWASILLVSNAGFELDNPLMCSAANLAYRKSSFESVNGFEGNEKILSGDDEFILKKITTQYGALSAIYLKHSGLLVKTTVFHSFKDLLNQRIRWSSKWNAHPSGMHKFTALLSLTIQLIFIGSFFLLSMGSIGIMMFIGIWSIKGLAERLVLGNVLEGYGYRLDLLTWIGTSVLHPFYVLATAFGTIRGKYRWKGREIYDIN